MNSYGDPDPDPDPEPEPERDACCPNTERNRRSPSFTIRRFPSGSRRLGPRKSSKRWKSTGTPDRSGEGSRIKGIRDYSNVGYLFRRTLRASNRGQIVPYAEIVPRSRYRAVETYLGAYARNARQCAPSTLLSYSVSPYGESALAPTYETKGSIPSDVSIDDSPRRFRRRVPR